MSNIELSKNGKIFVVSHSGQPDQSGELKNWPGALCSHRYRDNAGSTFSCRSLAEQKPAEKVRSVRKSWEGKKGACERPAFQCGIDWWGATFKPGPEEENFLFSLFTGADK